jgi:ribosomal protein L30
LQALGLGRPGATSERPDETSVRGMIAIVRHLVEVQANDAPASS